ncbi:hypothetical protein MNV49_004832 [Pseudohyphozyma bogoriensis]|nr:hypothetical protein MNV49_004832 [Pseudohyphozyma bogoriensis]
MPNFTLAAVLLASAGAAYWGMWIVGEQNQILASANAVCGLNGVRTSYTTIPAIDKTLCLLVAFFDAASSADASGPYRTLFMSVFFAPLVISQLEGSRPGAPLLNRLTPLILGAAAQLKGAGLVFPIWFAVYSILGSVGPTTSRATKIRTIFPGLVATYIIPALVMADPHHLLQKNTRYIGSAFFQVFPLTLAVFQLFLQVVLPRSNKTPEQAKQACLTHSVILTSIVYYVSLFDVHKLAVANNQTYLQTIQAIFNVPIYTRDLATSANLFLFFDGGNVLFSTFIFVAFAPGRKAGLQTALMMLTLTPIIGPAASLLVGWSSAGKEVKSKAA